MKKDFKLGFIFAAIFLLLSFVIFCLPCNPQYFAGGFFGASCSSETLFILLNLPGAIVINLVTQSKLTVYEYLPFTITSMILNSIIYFFVGFLIKKLIFWGKK